jgi:hypothetical protein
MNTTKRPLSDEEALRIRRDYISESRKDLEYRAARLEVERRIIDTLERSPLPTHVAEFEYPGVGTVRAGVFPDYERAIEAEEWVKFYGRKP